VTTVGPLSVTVQPAIPEQPPPLQPTNSEPPFGDAVRATTVPLTKLAEQIAPQLMPPGLLVTVPVPAPAGETVSTKIGCVKVAVTAVAAVSVTTQSPVPVQPPPLQPVKTESTLGVAVNVTTVPIG